jgi:protein-S-isoprenylcysteine O-methyltransferase Ste14
VAAAIDVLLLVLFAVQHTVMARPWFKRRWTCIVPAPAERTTFVLAASLVLALLFWLWQPVATAATGYILAGIAFEEHDLIQILGGTYAAYRARVPALIPRRQPPWKTGQ